MLFLISLTWDIYGQETAVVTGTIKDQNGQEIPHAWVGIPALGINTVSDISGTYTLNGVPPGSYTVVVRSVGFETFYVSIAISAGEEFTQEIILTESIQELNAVTVTGKSVLTETAEQPYAVTAISTKAFANRSVDLNQILGQSTGIRIREEGGLGSKFQFSLNGLSGRQVKFFIDGVPMEYLGDAFQLNNIPANLVKQVDVYKGVIPIELGSDALGGAINIVTDLYAKPYLDASYSLGSFGTHRAAFSGLYKSNSSGLLIRANGFFNRSDNDYIMEDIKVYDYQNGKDVRNDVRRFHDAYQSQMGQVEAGFTGKKWADLLMFGVTMAGIKQDVQHGIFGNPVGEATVEERNHQITLQYHHAGFVSGKLEVQIHAQHNWLNSVSIDTSSNRYDWAGRVYHIAKDGLGEIVREKTIFDYNQSLSVLRTGFSYTAHQHHKIKANVVGTHLSRDGVNTLKRDRPGVFTSPNTLTKLVSGVAIESNWLDEKVSTIASLKHYAFDMLTRNARGDEEGKPVIDDIQTSLSKPGFAFAARYFITPDLLLKSSVEKTYRLPEAREALGDGLRIIAAPLLKPESSLNLNGGLQFRKHLRESEIVMEGNYFYRNVSNWVYLESYGMLSQHTNVMNVLVHGLEMDTRFTYKNRVGLFANVTYQNVLNNEKYDASKLTKTENPVYRDQLANTPYFFGNAGIDFRFKKLANGMEFSTYYNASYVHWFYLVYKSASVRKNTIPTQLINNAGITCSSANHRYNISFEIRNFLNEKAYDNFKMQKPGRSFAFKVRYFIKSS
ncbi:MAG TPA: TonB-dependent receptor plug domain-containing protein [Ohtaekwangia sp.]|nr:TonB-dependent receptor plug domain-containing protein [Ohtaekwangia sp.]